MKNKENKYQIDMEKKTKIKYINTTRNKEKRYNKLNLH